jgi:hypothetical protein
MPAGDELSPDEKTWVKGVAMLQSISTAVALWAFLKSVTPKILKPEDDVMPLITIHEKLPDGRILTWARFEMWWTIAALATFAAAISMYGLLRRHWRINGLERVAPETPVPETRIVFYSGIVSIVVWGIHRLVADAKAAAYFPILGGMIEVAALYFLWVSILSCWRVSRPITREYLMWSGFWRAILPPIIELFIFLHNWKVN